MDCRQPCDRDQVVALIGRRLESLYRVGRRPVRPRPSRRTRSRTPWCAGWSAWAPATSWTRSSATASVASRKGRWPPTLLTRAARRGRGPARELDRKIVGDRAGVERGSLDAAIVVPSDEAELAAILAEAIAACTGELGAAPAGIRGRGRTGGSSRPSATAPTMRSSGSWWASATRRPQGGALSRQIDEVAQRAGGITPVVVRSTAFPPARRRRWCSSSSKLVADGGRRVVVEDSDWRTMMALSRFRAGRESDPVFAAWLGRTRPLTGLAALRAILGLDRHEVADTGRRRTVRIGPQASRTLRLNTKDTRISGEHKGDRQQVSYPLVSAALRGVRGLRAGALEPVAWGRRRGESGSGMPGAEPLERATPSLP